MIIPTACPPWTHLGKKLESMFRKALYQFNLLEGVNNIAVALSGGKDSLTLLYLLKAISGRGFPSLEIHAIHVSGEFSCGASISESYLKAICQELDVNFISRVSELKREDLECYSCSRIRRKLIFDAAKEVGATTIAFGHHRDDSIETLMMNLLHKAEFAGNLPKVPMHDYGITIIRPLIYIAEKDIVNFAQHYGFARIVCQCPVGQHSLRRQVKEIIDDLEQTFPNARENLSQASLKYGSDKALGR
jgi:tRNA 2-thiocytidine biosynthesis protein TtcA